MGANGHSRGSVLVVEDEPTIAEVVAHYLNRAGYRTRVAGDGVAAAALDDPPLAVDDAAGVFLTGPVNASKAILHDFLLQTALTAAAGAHGRGMGVLLSVD